MATNSEHDPVVDEKLWRQCKAVMAKVTKKPVSLPSRIGAVDGLTEDDSPVVVSLVDGDIVKIKYDMDFAESCQEECCDWCDGIWIDGNLPQRDWPFLLYRAAHEYRDMCKDEYSEEVAHKNAQKGERELRLAEWKDRGRGL